MENLYARIVFCAVLMTSGTERLLLRTNPWRCGGGSKGEGGHLRASELSAFPLGTLFGSFFPCRKKELLAAQAKRGYTTELRCK